jgi:hypothetical protein
MPLPLAFLLGTLMGAFGFARVGYPAVAVPVVVVGALAWWTARWEGGARGPR